MSYHLLPNSDLIYRVRDGASIPPEPTLPAYREYLAWVAEGNSATPLPTPAPSQEMQDVEVARNYAKLRALRTMTPAQVDAWVEANVTSLATAKDAIKTLAIAVAILARRL